jgi:DNA-binding FadR family transcriptional regulator
VLADFLELRRVFAVFLASRHRTELLAAIPQLTSAAAVVMAGGGTLDEVVDADLAFTRAVIDAGGNFAASAMFHTIERVIRDVPFVAEAFYAVPGPHERLVTGIATALIEEPDGTRLAARIDPILAEFDEAAVAAFERYLSAASG